MGNVGALRQATWTGSRRTLHSATRAQWLSMHLCTRLSNAPLWAGSSGASSSSASKVSSSSPIARAWAFCAHWGPRARTHTGYCASGCWTNRDPAAHRWRCPRCSRPRGLTPTPARAPCPRPRSRRSPRRRAYRRRRCSCSSAGAALRAGLLRGVPASTSETI